MKASENKRLALQIATMLPEKKRAAREVYRMVGELIEGWIWDEEPAENRPGAKSPKQNPKPRLVSSDRAS